MWRWLTGGALLVLVCAFQAGAAPAKKWTVGIWTGQAHFDDDKTFESCTIETTYRTGLAIMFRIRRDFAWDLNLFKPLWSLTASELPVELLIDDFKPISATAAVADKRLISIPLPNSDRAASLLRRGRVLTIKAGAASAAFNLEGTFAGISRLAQCVVKHLKAEAKKNKSRGLFASLEAGKSKSRKKRRRSKFKRIDRMSATVFISNLLIKSGQSGFKILSPKEHPLKGYEVIWETADGVIGAFAGVKNVKGKELDTVAALLIAQEAATCKGNVASGKKATKAHGSVSLQRVFVACQQEKNSFEVHHTLVQSEPGTFLKITHVAYGDAPNGSLGEADAGIIQHADWKALD